MKMFKWLGLNTRLVYVKWRKCDKSNTSHSPTVLRWKWNLTFQITLIHYVEPYFLGRTGLNHSIRSKTYLFSNPTIGLNLKKRGATKIKKINLRCSWCTKSPRPGSHRATRRQEFCAYLYPQSPKPIWSGFTVLGFAAPKHIWPKIKPPAKIKKRNISLEFNSTGN